MTDPQPFWEADPDAWRLVIETNILGVFLMSRAIVPHMLAAGRGSIINVTVNESTMVRRGFSPYGAPVEVRLAKGGEKLRARQIREGNPGGSDAARRREAPLIKRLSP